MMRKLVDYYVTWVYELLEKGLKVDNTYQTIQREITKLSNRKSSLIFCFIYELSLVIYLPT